MTNIIKSSIRNFGKKLASHISVEEYETEPEDIDEYIKYLKRARKRGLSKDENHILINRIKMQIIQTRLLIQYLKTDTFDRKEYAEILDEILSNADLMAEDYKEDLKYTYLHEMTANDR